MLHHEKWALCLGVNVQVEVPHQTDMREPPRVVEFLLKIVERRFARTKLDRHAGRVSQYSVNSFIHDPKSTLAELANQAITTAQQCLLPARLRARARMRRRSSCWRRGRTGTLRCHLRSLALRWPIRAEHVANEGPAVSTAQALPDLLEVKSHNAGNLLDQLVDRDCNGAGTDFVDIVF